MQIISEQKIIKESEDHFNGQVEIKSLFNPVGVGQVNGILVSFKPGARTAWQIHSVGQNLIILSGKGWIQVEGSFKLPIKEGDVVQFESGEKHWYGSTETDEMSCIAIQENNKEGKAVEWLEPVSYKNYRY